MSASHWIINLGPVLKIQPGVREIPCYVFNIQRDVLKSYAIYLKSKLMFSKSYAMYLKFTKIHSKRPPIRENLHLCSYFNLRYQIAIFPILVIIACLLYPFYSYTSLAKHEARLKNRIKQNLDNQMRIQKNKKSPQGT